MRLNLRSGKNHLRVLSGAAAAAIALLTSGSVFAANGTWSGGAGDHAWASPGNWDTVPGASDGTFVSTDIATFNIDDTFDTVIVDTNRNVSGITFDTNAGAYVFSGAALHLTGGGTTQIASAAINSQTLNDLTIEGSSYTIASNSGNFGVLLNTGALTFGATAGAGTVALTGTNPGVLNTSIVVTANTINGLISNGGASSLNLNVTSSAWQFNGANTYTGTTTVDGSSTFLVLGNDSALGASTLVVSNSGMVQASSPRTMPNNVQLPSTALFNGNQAMAFNGSLTFTGSSTLTNNLVGGGQAVTFAGPVFLSNSLLTPRTVTFNGAGSTVLGGQINDGTPGVGGSVKIVKSGSSNSSLTLSGNNAGTFTGGVQLSSGFLLLGDNNALGSAALTISGGTIQGSGAARTIGNNLTLASSATFSGSQDLTFTGALTNSGGSNTITAASTTNALTFSGPVYLSEASGTGRTLTLSVSPSATATISGVIANFNVIGSGQAGNLTKSGNGTLILTAANTYTGATSVNSGTLQLGNGGTAGSVAGAISVGSGDTLAINRDGTFTIANAITGAGALVDNSPSTSTAIFTAAEAYTGGTTVNSGTLVTTSAASGAPLGTGSITLNGGQLKLAPSGPGSSIAYTGASILATSRFSYGGGATLVLDRGSETGLSFTVGSASPSAAVIQRLNHGTLVIAPAHGTANLGSATSEKFLSTGTAPTLINGIVNTTIVAQDPTIASLPGDFLTYGTNGFVKATYSAGTDINAAGATAVYNAGTGSNNNVLAATASVYALNTGGQTIDFASQTLNVGDNTAGHQAGVILNSGGGTIDGGTLNFGAAEGTIYTSLGVSGGLGATVAAAITGTGGVTTFGPGLLTLTGASTYSGGTTVNTGTLTLDTAGSLTDPTITVNKNATANFNGTLSPSTNLTANGTVNFGSNATSTMVNRPLSSITIGSGATVTVQAATFPFTPTVLQPSFITFTNATSKIDLTNNELISAGDATTALGLILAGKVFSSTSTANLGYITLDASNFEIRWTLLGDTNLDGTVNVSDLGNLATNFGTTSGASWINGDFDRNGTVNVADLGDLATNFGQSLAAGSEFGAGELASASASVAAVPEPTSITLLGISFLAMMRTRRRRAE